MNGRSRPLTANVGYALGAGSHYRSPAWAGWRCGFAESSGATAVVAEPDCSSSWYSWLFHGMRLSAEAAFRHTARALLLFAVCRASPSSGLADQRLGAQDQLSGALTEPTGHTASAIRVTGHTNEINDAQGKRASSELRIRKNPAAPFFCGTPPSRPEHSAAAMIGSPQPVAAGSSRAGARQGGWLRPGRGMAARVLQANSIALPGTSAAQGCCVNGVPVS